MLLRPGCLKNAANPLRKRTSVRREVVTKSGLGLLDSPIELLEMIVKAVIAVCEAEDEDEDGEGWDFSQTEDSFFGFYGHNVSLKYNCQSMHMVSTTFSKLSAPVAALFRRTIFDTTKNGLERLHDLLDSPIHLAYLTQVTFWVLLFFLGPITTSDNNTDGLKGFVEYHHNDWHRYPRGYGTLTIRYAAAIKYNDLREARSKVAFMKDFGHLPSRRCLRSGV